MRRAAAALGIVVAAASTACVSTRELMASAVLDRAQHDLVCDTASIKTRMAGVISKYKSEKQGNVERATYAAEGCGASEVYTVECIRGVCFAVQDVPPKKNEKLKENAR
jgi:hypothetical protein